MLYPDLNQDTFVTQAQNLAGTAMVSMVRVQDPGADGFGFGID